MEQNAKYVSNISLKKADGSFILSGKPFSKDEITNERLSRLLKQGVVCTVEDFQKVENTMSGGMRQLVSRLEETKISKPQEKQQVSNQKNTPSLTQILAGQKKEKAAIPSSIWDADPEELKNMEQSILYSVYVEQCEKYGLTPIKEANKEALIKIMSADFKPKK